jgi:hypothetical protein
MTHIADNRNAYGVKWRSLKVTHQLEHNGVDKKILLK